MSEGKPFDDIRALAKTMPQPDMAARKAVQHTLEVFAGPSSPLGRTEVAVTWLAGWQGRAPSIDRPLVAVFAGSHDVAKSVFNKSVVEGAKERVKHLSGGIAGVRGIAGSLNAAFKVYEMGMEYPAADLTVAAALSERDCAGAIAFGMEVVAEGADIIALGNAGFGSATAAAAIVYGLYGGTPEYWAGGEADAAKARVDAVEKAATTHKTALTDPLEVLRVFGGRDISGLVGAILAARHQSIPVILDGFVVCAAAAILHEINADAVSHCIAGHVSCEPAHGALLDRLGLPPLLDFGIGMGDGTGAAMAVGVLKNAAAAIDTMAE